MLQIINLDLGSCCISHLFSLTLRVNDSLLDFLIDRQVIGWFICSLYHHDSLRQLGTNNSSTAIVMVTPIELYFVSYKVCVFFFLHTRWNSYTLTILALLNYVMVLKTHQKKRLYYHCTSSKTIYFLVNFLFISSTFPVCLSVPV
jgi:hypothetical protein